LSALSAGRTIIHAVTALINSCVAAAAINIDAGVTVDVHLAMATTPITAPMAPIAVVGDDGADRHADAESNEWRVRIINISRGRVINRWWVRWNVNDLWVRGRDLNDRVRDDNHPLLHFRFHDHIGDHDNLLLGGSERAGLLRLHAQRLDHVHHVLVLIKENFPELNGPWQIVIHLLESGRDFRDRLYRGIPGLRIDLRHVVRVLHEPRGLNDLKRIYGRRQ
jgi:hypothetical protein